MTQSVAQTGGYSPLRYPGGKGKLAQFVALVVQENHLLDGTYVEPYAGGAGIAWELLLTGVVRRIHLNDLDPAIYTFWRCLLERPNTLVSRVMNATLSVEEWREHRAIYRAGDYQDIESMGFAVLYLNRVQRSGILNGGLIGGVDQTGPWKMDARFNRAEIASKISKLSEFANRVTLTNDDALTLLEWGERKWGSKTLVYLDPPYFAKANRLYDNHYKPADHQDVARSLASFEKLAWIVSYDAHSEIERLYAARQFLRYQIGYSARTRSVGTELMFFSDQLEIPQVTGSMIELGRAA